MRGSIAGWRIVRRGGIPLPAGVLFDNLRGVSARNGGIGEARIRRACRSVVD